MKRFIARGEFQFADISYLLSCISGVLQSGELPKRCLLGVGDYFNFLDQGAQRQITKDGINAKCALADMN